MTERPVRLIIARRLAVASLAAVAFVAACESKLPTDAEIRAMDATMVERRVAGTIAPAGSEPVWYVDGKQVPADAAKEIPAERIAGVSVEKETPAIHITTLDRAPGQPNERESVVERRVEGRPLDASIVTRDPASSVRIVRRAPNDFMAGFTGVLVVDGVVVEHAKWGELTPDRIESVSVFKGEAAVRVYGPDAVNGAIVVKTKQR